MGFGFFEGGRGIYLWISKDMIHVPFFQKLAQGLMGHSLVLRRMVNLTIKKNLESSFLSSIKKGAETPLRVRKTSVSYLLVVI